MIDREYIKLNTSIQTASNSHQLIEDENGNVPAVIELDLPGDIFTSKDGGKKVDKVSMLTSKMRLSLNQTPLAQIPTIPYPPDTNVILSSCQMDVYPYAILDNEIAKPNPNSASVGQTFPYYKDHTTTYRIKGYNSSYDDVLEAQDLEELITVNNCPGYGFPESDRFYSIFNETGIIEEHKHLMNLTLNSARRDSIEVQGGSALVKSLGVISQMLQDGLENAISYASESDNTIIDVYLIPVQYASTYPPPAAITSSTVFVEEFNEEMCVWYWEPASDDNSLSSDLEWAVKPKIMFDEQSMRISYDTAAFKKMVPILWNTPFVDTYDIPEQMTLDSLRNSVWDGEPPPKRVYQYDVTTVDDPASYNFALKNPINCGLMNIIGNREMRDTFSFLPWIKVKLSDLSLYRESSYKYKVRYIKSGYARTTVGGDYYINSTSGVLSFYDQKTSVEATDTRYLKYTFKVPVGGDRNNQSIRYDQNVELVETTSSSTALSFTAADRRVASMPYSLEEFTGDPFDTSLPPQTYSSYQTDNTNYSVGDQVVGNLNVALPPREEITETHPDHLFIKSVPGYESLFEFIDFIGCYLRPPYGEDSSNKWLPGTYIGGQHYMQDILPPLAEVYDFRKWIPSTTPVSIDSSHNTDPDRTYDIYYYYWEILVDDNSNRNFFNGVMNTAITTLISPPIHEGDMKYYQRATTSITNVLTFTRSVSEEDESAVSRKAIIPNLDLDNEMCFYMLDCITAKMDIGSQEVIQTNKNIFKVQTTPSTETEKTDWYVKTYNSTNIQPATTDNRSYEKYAFFEGLPSNWYIDYVPVTYEYEDDGETITTTENVTAEYMVDTLQLVTFTYENKTYYTIQGYFQSGGNTYFKARTDISNVHNADVTTTVTGETVTTYSNDLSLEPTTDPVVTTLNTTTSEYENIQQTISVTDAGYGAPPTFSGSKLPDSWIFLPMNDIVTYTSITFSFYSDEPYVLTDISMNRFIPTAIENADYSQTFTGDIDGFIPDGETEPISLENVTFTRYEWAVEGDFEQVSANVDYRGEVTSNDEGVTFPTLSQLAADDLIQGVTAVDAWGYTLNRVYEDETYKTTVTETQSMTIEAVEPTYKGNVRLGFTWNGLPTVTLSPITSFVLRLGGIQSTQEILPVNIATNNYAASQISSIPIIENYFSTASSFRELHDELVVIKDQFTTAAVYNLPDTSGQERIIKFMAQYITKDGKIHQLYVPKNGVFWLQLTFAVDYVPIY